MTRVLIVAASLGLTLSAAGACDFMRSADAGIDHTVVATVTTDDQKSMSTPVIIVDQAKPAETDSVTE